MIFSNNQQKINNTLILLKSLKISYIIINLIIILLLEVLELFGINNKRLLIINIQVINLNKLIKKF